jgi:hypothetical protein
VGSRAEFMHGKLRTTVRLLKEAGIDYYKMKGQMLQEENGEIKHGQDFDGHWHLFAKRLKKL